MTQAYILGILLLICIIGWGIFFCSSKGVYQTMGVVIAGLSLTSVFLLKDYNPLRDEYSNSDYPYSLVEHNIEDSPTGDIDLGQNEERDTIKPLDNFEHTEECEGIDDLYCNGDEYSEITDDETDFIMIEGDGRGGLPEFDEDYYSLRDI